MSWRIGVALLLLASCVAPACAKKTPTQVVVRIDAEPALEADASRIEITILDHELGMIWTGGRDLGPTRDTLPIDIGLLPRGGDATRTFTVSITLFDARSDVLLERTVQSGFIADRRVDLDVLLCDACRRASCMEGTCTSGPECADSDWIDPAHPSAGACGSPVPPDGGPDAMMDGGPDAPMSDGDVPPPSCRISDVALGEQFVCVLTVVGEIYCAGANTFGELGRGSIGGSSDSELQPVLPPAGMPSTWTAIGAGRKHACGVYRGTVHCWGNGVEGQLGYGTVSSGTPMATDPPIADVHVLAGGEAHSCALDALPAVWCWGSDANGAIGDGSLGGIKPPTAISVGVPWTGLALGRAHSCAVQEPSTGLSTFWGWGANNQQQVVAGTATNVTSPRMLALDLSGGFAGVTAGGDHSCAWAGSILECWGSNDSGEVGLPESTGGIATPARMTGYWKGAAAGGRFTCGATTDGVLECWGRNDACQLGRGPTATPELLARTHVPASIDQTDVRTGVVWDRAFAAWGRACAMRNDGTVYCWGSNPTLELGPSAIQCTPKRLVLPGCP